MTTTTTSWETRVADLWKTLEDHEPDAFIARLEVLFAELPPGSAIALFEWGAAQDSTGRPDLAVPLYEAALEAGLAAPQGRHSNGEFSA